MKATERAYLAGLIDGEGCFYTTLPTSWNTPASLRIGMRDKDTISWVHDRCGGFMYEYTNEVGSTMYRCEIGAGATKEVIRMVYKYLVTKKHQAEVMLQLIDTTYRKRRTEAVEEKACVLASLLKNSRT
jgi:hypothetical protein